MGTAALAAALVMVASACRGEARSQADDGPATIPCNIPAIPAHGKTTCTNGDWHFEALGIASANDAGHAGDNVRRSR